MMMGKTGLCLFLSIYVCRYASFHYMASQTHTFHFSMTITGNTKDPNDDDALWKINYNADRTTDVVVNEHFCRWEVHTEKPSVAPSSSPSFLPSLRPSDSPSLAVSDICLIFQLKTKARIPNHIFLTLAGILFSVFVLFSQPSTRPSSLPSSQPSSSSRPSLRPSGTPSSSPSTRSPSKS